MSGDHVPAERERLRGVFDRAADRCQQARPDYPVQLFDDLLQMAGLRHGDRLLEIGCGTGKATAPLATRGFRITCLEPGARLAAAAQANLGALLDVTVINSSYEEWQRPVEGRPGDVAWPRPGELPDDRAEIVSTGLFDDVQVRHYDWEVQYDTESYLDLLNTFSGHIAMAPRKREHLYSTIRSRLAERPERYLRRHWGAVLHVAHRSAAN